MYTSCMIDKVIQERTQLTFSISIYPLIWFQKSVNVWLVTLDPGQTGRLKNRIAYCNPSQSGPNSSMASFEKKQKKIAA